MHPLRLCACAGLAGVLQAEVVHSELLGSSPFPPSHQSPRAATQFWDEQTLASFSVSQLDALARLASGWCPLLSRAVACVHHGGRRKKQLTVEAVEAYLQEEAELARRQAKAMMRHIWTNYELYAFGKDELKPVTGHGVDNWGGMGMTLVDSLDTLWLMGLRAEFDRAATWVEQSLSFDKDVNVNLFETTIRQLGGLIAAYAYSEREGILSKAKDLGSRLIKAFALPPQAPRVQESVRHGHSEAAKGADKERWSASILSDLLRQMGLSQAQAATDSLLGSGIDLEATKAPNALPPTSLPFSDVNLKTGKVQNLASFVSLAEAYVPVEWKALALFTGNCSYAYPQNEVLRTVNRTAELEGRGLAPIFLKPDGTALQVLDNRISLGSRGDSFYEYLLKDSLWSDEDASSSWRPQRLWSSFRAQLSSLFVESHHREPMAQSQAQQPRHRQRRGRRATSGAKAAAAGQRSEVKVAAHAPGMGGTPGGWFETWRDAALPWLFLKEVSYTQTIPKIDHLVCFLPGTLALDVLLSGQSEWAARAAPTHNESTLARERLTQLLLAHRLLQTCVHMYFRTASDLAPEITRFNALGLKDDLGSMHNILRPETVESLFFLWRATKAQIYRNWGQRILAAFGRRKTRFGFASLHNVNRPTELRDDMPSYFVAETVKYLFLLFADDSVLSLEDVVITTEAHPMPTIKTARTRMNVHWRCGGSSALRETTAEQPPSQPRPPSQPQSEAEVQSLVQQPPQQQEPEAPDKAEATIDAAGLAEPALEASVDSPRTTEASLHAQLSDEPGGEPHTQGTETDSIGDDHGAFLGLPEGNSSLPVPASESTCEVCEHRLRALTVALADAQAQLAQCAAARAMASPTEPPPPMGTDPSCWVEGYSAEACCLPPPKGNPLCWDELFTYRRCCANS